MQLTSHFEAYSLWLQRSLSYSIMRLSSKTTCCLTCIINFISCPITNHVRFTYLITTKGLKRDTYQSETQITEVCAGLVLAAKIIFRFRPGSIKSDQTVYGTLHTKEDSAAKLSLQ